MQKSKICKRIFLNYSVAEAVGIYLVVYGVLPIRRNNNNNNNNRYNHTLKICTTMTTMNGGGGGYCNIPFLLRTT